MSDPFYVTRGEIKHKLSRLTAILQKLTISEHDADNSELYQSTGRLLGDLDHLLKDLADTLAIQTTNAKKLGLSMPDLATRKDIVNTHQREFSSLRDEFAGLVKADSTDRQSDVVPGLYQQRRTSKRRFEVERENSEFAAVKGDSMQRAGEPSRESMHEMKQRFDEEDEDDLVEVFQKKAAAAQQADLELGVLAKGANRRSTGVVRDWMGRHFPLTNRRNRIIFFSFPVVLVVIVVIIILAITLR